MVQALHDSRISEDILGWQLNRRSLPLVSPAKWYDVGGRRREHLRGAHAGTSTLTIRETQHKTWDADGALTVTSEPVLDFVGGSKYTTRAEFRVEAEGADCKVCSDFCHVPELMKEYTGRPKGTVRMHDSSVSCAMTALRHVVKIMSD